MLTLFVACLKHRGIRFVLWFAAKNWGFSAKANAAAAIIRHRLVIDVVKAHNAVAANHKTKIDLST